MSKLDSHILKFFRPLLLFTLFLLSLSCLEKGTEKKKRPSEKQKEETKTTEKVSLPKPADLVKVAFEPNPVEPNKALTIRVKIEKPTDEKLMMSGSLAFLYEKSKKVIVCVPGASSASHTSLPIEESVSGLEGTYFWYKAKDRVELRPSGVDEWSVGCIAPTDESLYFVKVIVKSSSGEEVIENPDWILKVFPEWWEKKESYNTPEEAIRADLKKGVEEDLGVSVKVEKIKERKLLPDDRRDNRYLKLFSVEFILSQDTPVLPKGSHIQYYYVLRESPEGNWKVLGSGSAP